MTKTIKNIRLKAYSYQDGFYFITICSNFRKVFTDNEQKIITRNIENLSNAESGVELDYYSLLSNHVHLIVILKECKIRLGEVIRRFKARTSKDAGARLWQPNYYEHVIRSEKALDKIREYIENNPLKENIDFNEIYNS